MSRNYHVAIVGATGAVGVEMLKVLERRNFPVGKLTLLASARSAGKVMQFKGAPVTVEELREDSFGDVDVALFSAGGSISNKYAPLAVQSGAVVVDNSSAFRMDEHVPLVIPEINGADIRQNRFVLSALHEKLQGSGAPSGIVLTELEHTAHKPASAHDFR